jgi:tagatose-6-phosphate ketose/aldose isomerase
MDVFGLNTEQLERAGAQWTAREILQQPDVWNEIDELVSGDARLGAFLEPLLGNAALRIVLTGAGTSGFIGECLAPALISRLGKRVEAISTTDLVASPRSGFDAGTPTLLVSFSRSGGSPEAVAALDVAEACVEKCYHLVVTCDPQGALIKCVRNMPNAYAILLPDASNDRSFAMTSSFTGMLLAAAIALGLGAKRSAGLGRIARQIVPERAALLQNLVAGKFERIVYLGSKELKGLSRECALKMLELTDGKVVAMADSPLGFRHGPKTVLNPETLVVVFVCNDDYTRQYDLDLIAELRRDGVAGRVVAICAKPGVPGHSDNVELQGSGYAEDLELCLPYAMFAQSLALLRSLSFGVRPDNPKEAGTVSRVVKGVAIYPWRGVA